MVASSTTRAILGFASLESGRVIIESLRMPWKDAFGWDVEKKSIVDAIPKIPFAKLALPT